jgi:hypothetical protein
MTSLFYQQLLCIGNGFVATVSLQEMGFLIFSQNSILFVSNKRVSF